jgi:hypothetical protein
MFVPYASGGGIPEVIPPLIDCVGIFLIFLFLMNVFLDQDYFEWFYQSGVPWRLDPFNKIYT